MSQLVLACTRAGLAEDPLWYDPRQTEMPRNAPTEALLDAAKRQLGARIAELRTATKMSQEQAAAAAGMNRETWGRIEAGKSHPRFDSLLRMQFVLRVDTLDALFAPTTGDLFGRDP